jgi:sulfur-oxidizing protein SoxX
MKNSTLILSALMAGAFATAHAGEDLSGKVAKLVADSFKPGAGQDMSRLVQDETQKICSVTHNNPSAAQTAAINAREQATIKYPE